MMTQNSDGNASRAVVYDGWEKSDDSDVPDGLLNAVCARVSAERMDTVEFYTRGDVSVAVMADRSAESNAVGAITILGCSLCVNANISRDEGGRMLVSGRRTVPLSAISDDAERCAFISLIALCPDCGTPIIDRSSDPSTMLIDVTAESDTGR